MKIAPPAEWYLKRAFALLRVRMFILFINIEIVELCIKAETAHHLLIREGR